VFFVCRARPILIFKILIIKIFTLFKAKEKVEAKVKVKAIRNLKSEMDVRGWSE